ncbi:MAG: hypothetical protein J6P13_04340 [Kiritimatiellae bacterium]|nr:hypothetical protein [Kiritimatiellia bacterium]
MFAGRVDPGREYILVNGHVTQGGTIDEPRSFIENDGGGAGLRVPCPLPAAREI